MKFVAICLIVVFQHQKKKESDEKSAFIANSQNKNVHKSEKNYFFFRPEKNEYSNEELYEMKIREIIIGIHPTIYKKEKKSFHPFFYLKLYRKDVEIFGVIVQYLKIPPDVKENQMHVYEEDGVEFIEKYEEDFENELRNIFYYSNIIIGSLSEWIFTYNNMEFESMTLFEFFKRVIPAKGIWLQKELNPKNQKSCFHFCIDAIKNLNITKKAFKPNEKRIKNLGNALLETSNSENFDLYIKAFIELIFKTIIDPNK